MEDDGSPALLNAALGIDANEKRRERWRRLFRAMTDDFRRQIAAEDGQGLVDTTYIRALVDKMLPGCGVDTVSDRDILLWVEFCTAEIEGMTLISLPHAIDIEDIRAWATERRLAGLIVAICLPHRPTWRIKVSHNLSSLPVSKPPFPILSEGRTSLFISHPTTAVAAALEF